MPSRRVSAYQEILHRFRRRPAAIAMAAGGIGLLCGALAVALTWPPAAPPRAAQIVLKPPVETTGAAPQAAQPLAVASGETAIDANADAATSDCDEQAWPYITRECLAKRDAKRRSVRIVTTDRIDPPAPAAIEPEQAVSPLRPAPVPVQQAKPQPPARVIAASETPAGHPAAEAVPLPLPRPEAADEPKRAANATAETVVPSKRTRDARLKQREQGRLRRAAQSVRADDVDDETARPRGRVVERWTEREFEVPSERGTQRRRVIVRSGNAYPPGPFGAMFGTVFR